MESGVRVKAVVGGCAWIRSTQAALGAVPELAQDLPAMVEISGEAGAVIPAPCVGELASPLVALIERLLHERLSEDRRDPIEELGLPELSGDDLVQALIPVLIDSAMPGLSASAVPALTLAWSTSHLLAGSAANVGVVDAHAAARLDAGRKALGARPPADRGLVLADLARSISGRLAAAITLARSAGYAVPADGLYRALLPSMLSWAFPRGSLDQASGPAEAASLLGLDLPAAHVDAIIVVLERVLQRGLEPRADHPLPDLLLHGVIQASGASREDLRPAWLHPVHGPWLVGALPALATDKDRQGLDKAIAQALSDAGACRAIAASWGSLTSALATWDVLASVASRIAPIQRREGLVRLGRRSISAPASLSWIAGGGGPRVGAVVAVDLAPAMEVARSAAGLAAGAARLAWIELCDREQPGLSSIQGQVGFALFPRVREAVAFASRAVRALSGPGTLPALPGQRPRTMQSSVKASAGIAWGEIHGGSDGVSVWLSGAADRAPRLLGGGPPAGAGGDPLGLREADLGPLGLHSEGTVVEPAAQEQLLTELSDAGVSLRRQGQGGTVAGVGQDFSLYPVAAWWLEGEEVAFLVQLQKAAFALATVQRMTADAFRQFAIEEAELFERRAGPTVRATSGATADDPFLGLAAAASPSREGAGADPFAEPHVGGAEAFPAAPRDPAASDPFGLPLQLEEEEEEHEPFGFALGEDEPGDGALATPEPALSAGLEGFDFGPPEAPAAAREFEAASEEEAPWSLADPGFDFGPGSAVEPGADAFEQETPPFSEADSAALPFPMEEEPETGPVNAQSVEGAGASLPGGEAEGPMVSIEEDWDDEEDEEEEEEPLTPPVWDEEVTGPITAGEPIGAPRHPADASLEEASLIDFTSDAGGGFFLPGSTSDPGPQPADASGFGSRPPLDPLETFPPEGLEILPEELGFAFGPAEGGAEPLVDEESEPLPPRNPAQSVPLEGQARRMAEALVRSFSRYVVSSVKGSHTFGVRDGGLLRDAHLFEGIRDPVDAYTQFLEAKIQEGLVPRPDLTAPDEPAGVNVDPDLLARAAAIVVSR